MTPIFLTLDEVLLTHELQLAQFGGADGVRDLGLLESAIAQPSASFGGEFLHPDLHTMAAAYLYHVAANHAFVDGNKRTALVAALAFLAVNGIVTTSAAPELYDLTIGVAEGRFDKATVADVLRRLFPGPT
jgi:death-on-curing protein